MAKQSIMVGLGDYYAKCPTGYAPLGFIYNNIKQLSGQLTILNWKNNTPLLDDAASARQINAKLDEVFATLESDDWLLFYYTGHASKYILDTSINPAMKTYCVTYDKNLSQTVLPPLKNFFSEIDYEDVVRKFETAAPNGHLVTILDCCFAYGLIDEFSEGNNFHTVIAASMSNASALYDTNSVFFTALTKNWEKPFNQLEAFINRYFQDENIPARCQVKPATKFLDQTL